MKKLLLVMAISVILVTACIPGQTPQQTQDQINTAVAAAIATQQKAIDDAVAATLTAVAQNASPTAMGPAVEFTSTPTALIFPTLPPIIPTITPVPVNPPSGGGGVPAKRDYACDIISRKPLDNTEYNKGAKFDIKWTIVNTGTKTWEAGYDVKYFNGPKMTTTSLFEIPVAMKPNAKYEMNLDAVAPNEKGSQVMTWTVQGQICYPYTAIIVK